MFLLPTWFEEKYAERVANTLIPYMHTWFGRGEIAVAFIPWNYTNFQVMLSCVAPSNLTYEQMASIIHAALVKLLPTDSNIVVSLSEPRFEVESQKS